MNTKKTVVHNLANDTEITFCHPDAISAVTFCYAEGSGRISQWHATPKNELPKVFPVVVGRFSVCCGDYAARRGSANV